MPGDIRVWPLLGVAVFWANSVLAIDGACVNGGGAGIPCMSDPPSGGSYADPGYYEPPPVYQPSPDEIASQKSSALHLQAFEAHKRGDYQEAVRLNNLALQAAPASKDTTATRHNLGQAYHQMGHEAYNRQEYAEAVRLFEMALMNWPDGKATKDYLLLAKSMIESQQRERQRSADLETARQRIAGLLGGAANLEANAASTPGADLDYWDGAPSPAGSGDMAADGKATAQNLPLDDAELFSRGDKSSAPVVFGPRNAFLAVEPRATEAVTPKPNASPVEPAGVKGVDAKAPLLTGPALAAAEQRARYDAAFNLGARFFNRGDHTSARRYFEEAIRVNPACEYCRTALERAKQSEETFGLYDKLMNIVAGPSRPDNFLDVMEEDLLGGGSEVAHVMSAFQYGQGDWARSIGYLEDLRKASPDDNTVLEALALAQMLQTAVATPEATSAKN